MSEAALDVAAEFAEAPEARFALITQRAGLMFRSNDFMGAEKAFQQAQQDTSAAGDAMNSSLAQLYLAVSRLFMLQPEAPPETSAPRLQAVFDGAREVAKEAGIDVQMAEYAFSIAVRTAYKFRFEARDALPVAAEALQAFRLRQAAMRGHEAGQLSTRREMREFLEIVISANLQSDQAP
ncbi:MAG TPA: hypothetical protein VGN97_23910 [Mesorhizobium sp.]|nr:hypothetical protein [Mesorhizobium sp.]